MEKGMQLSLTLIPTVEQSGERYATLSLSHTHRLQLNIMDALLFYFSSLVEDLLTI